MNFIRGLVFTLCSFASISAYAGLKNNYPVTVWTGSRTAQGQTGTARAASGTIAQIGCQAQVDGSGTLYGNCWAMDTSGNYGSCTVPSAQMSSYMTALSTAVTNGFYYFTWNASGVCTYLQMNSGSYLLPPAP